MKKLSGVIAATLGVLLFGLAMTGSANAQEDLLEYVVGECESDLRQYCSHVTPGNNRLMHCVAAHEDKISGQCQYALYQAATLLEQISTAIAYVAQSCAVDIKANCSDVKEGEGRILMCLVENEESVSDACNKAIKDTVGE